MSTRERRHQRVGDFALESGQVLRGVVQAYHLDGALNEARDNVVLLIHSLTGSSDAVGDWWADAVGPGRTIDTERYAVLCTNLLGSCYGTTFDGWDDDDRPHPPITTRDQARLIQGLVEELGIASVALVTGGSLGGMVALEWAAQNPEVARSVVVLAAPAAHTAHAIAWNHIQRRMIDVGGERGLEIARMVGMMTYRTRGEQAERFGRGRTEAGEWTVGAYLDYHGRKLRDRFTVRAYRTLTGAMDAHDVGAGRGGIGAALRRIQGRLIGVGIPGDLLYSAEDVRSWTEAAGAEYREILSIHGHDAFLLEQAQVAEILEDALRSAEPAGAGAYER